MFNVLLEQLDSESAATAGPCLCFLSLFIHTRLIKDELTFT